MAGISALVIGSPAFAETPEQLDALSDVTTQEQSGILFARTQASRGEWLEAIGTLERVLAIAPKSHEAKRLQALYLCSVDDRLGGAVILSQLKEKNYAKGALDEVFAMCREPDPAPAAEGAGQ
jgi:hypothetical protein